MEVLKIIGGIALIIIGVNLLGYALVDLMTN